MVDPTLSENKLSIKVYLSIILTNLDSKLGLVLHVEESHLLWALLRLRLRPLLENWPWCTLLRPGAFWHPCDFELKTECTVGWRNESRQDWWPHEESETIFKQGTNAQKHAAALPQHPGVRELHIRCDWEEGSAQPRDCSRTELMHLSILNWWLCPSWRYG